MRLLVLGVAVVVGVAGAVGYLLTGEVLLLAAGGVGVAVASGGWVLTRDDPRWR